MTDVHSLQDAQKGADSQSTTSINTVNNETPKYTIKDSVFRHLFLDPRYGLQLFHVLHPEDTEATEADISYLTIIREITNGSRKTRPDCLKLSRDLFHGKCADIELTVHMLYNGENEGDILDQYVSFTDQVDHFYKTYGRTQEAARKLIDYCIEHNILKDYLTSRTEEVTSMLEVIFDDTIHRKKMLEEAEARGESRGEARGEKRGERRGEKRGKKLGITKQAHETVLRLHRMHYDTDTIAEIVDVPVRQVEEWLSAELVL